MGTRLVLADTNKITLAATNSVFVVDDLMVVEDLMIQSLRVTYSATLGTEAALGDYLKAFAADNPTWAGLGARQFYEDALDALGVVYTTGLIATQDLAQLYWSNA